MLFNYISILHKCKIVISYMQFDLLQFSIVFIW